MGTVVQFPGRSVPGRGFASRAGTRTRRFTQEMRDGLERLAARTTTARPVLFGEDDDGAEFCRFGDGLVVGWDRECRPILIDTVSGYVDRGPFGDWDEVYLFLAHFYA